MSNGKYISYYRVSTVRQGQSGLGLDAQRVAVERHVASSGGQIVAEFTEVESGKNAARPKLNEAMVMCRLTGAVLVIAKLDRLSRDAAFLLNLRDAGVDFIAADMPQANRMTIGIMAVMAEHEREMISTRTKEALAAAKARGVHLGGWRGKMPTCQQAGVQALKDAADQFARMVGPVANELRDRGYSLQKIADELHMRGILTARGGKWTAKTVAMVIDRSSSLTLS